MAERSLPDRLDDLPAPRVVLPHRPPMLLLEHVEEWSDDGVRAVGRVPEESPYAASPPSLFAVEMGAQAAAYHATLPAVRDGGEAPGKGYLVRLGEVQLAVATLGDGDLEIEVDRQGGAGSLAIYGFSVAMEDGVLASGRLTIVRG